MQFSDGHIEEYAANIIAENLYSQVDEDGHHHMLLQELIDHHKNTDSLKVTDMWDMSNNGNRVPKRTTKGWDICILWRDGSTSWEPLCNLKESNPVELAEYAIAHQIANEPAFAWWVPYAIKK